MSSGFLTFCRATFWINNPPATKWTLLFLAPNAGPLSRQRAPRGKPLTARGAAGQTTRKWAVSWKRFNSTPSQATSISMDFYGFTATGKKKKDSCSCHGSLHMCEIQMAAGALEAIQVIERRRAASRLSLSACCSTLSTWFHHRWHSAVRNAFNGVYKLWLMDLLMVNISLIMALCINNQAINDLFRSLGCGKSILCASSSDCFFRGLFNSSEKLQVGIKKTTKMVFVVCFSTSLELNWRNKRQFVKTTKMFS